MSNDLHYKIMNIPATPDIEWPGGEQYAYNLGHKAARHAAAELALATPSVASGALPELPKPFFYYESDSDGTMNWGEGCVSHDDIYTNAEYAQENESHGGKVYSEAQMRAYGQACAAAAAPNAALEKVREALLTYCDDLTARKRGDWAQDRAFIAIQEAMGIHWEFGVDHRAALAQAGEVAQ